MMKFKEGTAVQHRDGRIGIVYDDHVRISGMNSGKIGVQFVAIDGLSLHSFAYVYPNELEAVKLFIK
jgi:hypothetical protein